MKRLLFLIIVIAISLNYIHGNNNLCASNDGIQVVMVDKGIDLSTFVSENTRYVFSHVHDLGEETSKKTWIVPKGCVLEFKGGCLRNGYIRIEGNYVTINADYKVFENIEFVGDVRIANSYIDASWFYDGKDIGNAVTQCMQFNTWNEGRLVKVPNGILQIETPIYLKGKTTLDLTGAKIFDNSLKTSLIMGWHDKEKETIGKEILCNITIIGGTIKASKVNSEYYTIDIADAYNITLDRVVVANSDNRTKYDGVRFGRKQEGYKGPVFANRVSGCQIPQLVFLDQASDNIVSNNLLWSSGYTASIISETSSMQIIGNELVGGEKGAVFLRCPKDKKAICVSNYKIIGNYFDGSYPSVDTHDGIYAEEGVLLRNSVINANDFWHQKECGINAKMQSVIISNNVFDDCDYYGRGFPDIKVKKGSGSLNITSNTFVRLNYCINSSIFNRPLENVNNYIVGSPISIEGLIDTDELSFISFNTVSNSKLYKQSTYIDAASLRSINNSTSLFE